MMSRLSRLFTVRHIVTHEFPHAPTFHLTEIDGFMKATSEFIEATDWVLVEALMDAVPRTQLTKSTQASDRMQALEGEMGTVIEVIKARGDLDPILLAESQAAWETYAQKEADAHASLVAGGSMYPMVWASARAEEIQRRVAKLRWWAERKEGDLF
jgi:uncharacterized protein YecT (DUF1311 family)